MQYNVNLSVIIWEEHVFTYNLSLFVLLVKKQPPDFSGGFSFTAVTKQKSRFNNAVEAAIIM